MSQPTRGDALRRIPDQIAAQLAGIADADLRRRPAADEWSVIETCCHLRDAIEIDTMRIRAMLAQDSPVILGFDGHQYLRQRIYGVDDIQRVLAALRANCAFAADVLDGLSAADLQRTGTHEEAGPITVESRAEWLVEHSVDHLQQIQATRRLFGS